MRLVACLTMCLMPILANAAQTSAQAPSDPQGYCVNRNADFYPYTGEPCKRGYQLGSGNCRNTNGRVVAVPSSAFQWPAQLNYRSKAEYVGSTGLKLQNPRGDPRSREPLPRRTERRLGLVEPIGTPPVRAGHATRLRKALIGIAAGDPASIITRVFGAGWR